VSEAVAAGAPLDSALREAARRLGEAGVTTPRVDAERLAAHVLGLSPGELTAAAIVGRGLGADEAERLADLVAERAARVPLQHLTGRAAFRGIELAVGPGVFVPRPETEIVAGLAIEAARESGAEVAFVAGHPVVVDLCTGSAAIALSVAVEVPAARVVALELEPHALAWAEGNIADVAPGRVELRAGDVAGSPRGVLADLAGAVDVVVANPPYIPPGARPVDPEVADHDPEAALYGGGADGLAVPRAVVHVAAALLRPGGVLVMEHGDAQGPACRAIAGTPAWTDVRTVADLTGRDRALVARRADAPAVRARTR
jgi:release factor glutamine methyltransferase